MNFLRNHKLFTSVFSVKGDGSNAKCKEAIETLGLSDFVNFKSVEENYRKLLLDDCIGTGTGKQLYSNLT